MINNLERDKKGDYVGDLITKKDSHEMLPYLIVKHLKIPC